MSAYTVWVGGCEVTDYLQDRCTAESIAAEYRDDGYDDVAVEEVTNP